MSVFGELKKLRNPLKAIKGIWKSTRKAAIPVATGAAAGFMAGGPVGAAVGGGAALLAHGAKQYSGKKGNFFTGRGAREIRSEKFQPDQISRLEELLAQSGEQFDFDPIEKGMRESFMNKTAPAIAERYAGLNALRGSGFQQALLAGGQDLDTRIGALKAAYRFKRGNIMERLGMMQRQDVSMSEAQPGALHELMPVLMKHLPGFLSKILAKKDTGEQDSDEQVAPPQQGMGGMSPGNMNVLPSRLDYMRRQNQLGGNLF